MRQFSGNRYFYFLFFVLCFLLFASCAVQKNSIKHDYDDLLNTPSLQSAHVGISVFDATSDKALMDHQGNKYFTPASNTKLFSLYAGLKYLGDSLTGIRYFENDTALYIVPTGDPTFLHPDFQKQPVADFLRPKKKNIYITGANWQDQALGAGWSWDDYNDDYSQERSAFPVYGNTIKWVQTQMPDNSFSSFSIPDVDWKVNFSTDTASKKFFVKRNLAENTFEITQGTEKYKEQDVPFVTNGIQSAVELLKDTISKNIFISHSPLPAYHPQLTILRSQPVDSLFRPMMWRSDNFFAEQTLMMVSNQVLGFMNDEKITDTLLNTDLKDLPQKPEWADGSGLSRFNLFTPQDFIFLLNKMKNEFGLERMKHILPTGGQGTLGNRYKADSAYLFAKTGSLSGVAALSGYLVSQKNHLLIFSVLINNYRGSGAQVRDAIQKFVDGLRRKY
ncbi:MAG: D-alanyl-D-alanine carboxypeptidase [Bacteroidetes bacterium]|nr:D-alanyl-D-alanine carboxypeptidase [Bacteroidota bacterium]MBS1972856.1 D-alanyl-D-alanine carboxypeptidase [Bacteroidota bacterium]